MYHDGMVYADEINEGDSFVYDGIEYRDVVIDHYEDDGRIIFYDDWDVRIGLYPDDDVEMIENVL